ncbi:metallophosphoesterase family protein [Tuberibacillus sp. Marseille-P3662]|uniref:metallophosphoesterase family protein n=1 Tax=Tuberibacillus sp. Marseille-P3662 TaxID=1965358 RepID=UPI000A1C7BDF|nr:metallophosphoesterase family protein [Tuberibacillus sp. Marseille-P3662]
MNVIVLADTHMPKRAQLLPEFLAPYLREADLIIHAGDWQTRELYDELRSYAPVEGVAGNVDTADMIERLGYQKRLIHQGYQIGLVHGHGEKGTTERRAYEAFVDDPPDIIIFGHSHIPYLRYHRKTLMFNPGSPTDKRRMPYFSFGVLSLGETFSAEHIFFKG